MIEVTKQKQLRALPSVDQLLRWSEIKHLSQQYGRSLTLEAIRAILNQQRATIINGNGTILTNEQLIVAVRHWLKETLTSSLQPVINGTGVIIHTNLGRAPLSQAAQTAVQAIGSGYATLEYDPISGKRGSRTIHPQKLLTQLTGAEAALVVNNNAAAVLLMLTALCQGKEVIISRGQLVEIGGGFRVPDVMVQSGAHLVEVGTTNRTHLRDYARAINEKTGAILVAHHSNYKIVGFTTEPSLTELAQLGQKHGLPLLFDQGSGALIDVAPYGLEPEPTVLDGLEAGCDIVAFSGDKLLGGPQAGILCGRADLMTQIKQHPLARAVRADKLCLAALTTTLRHYRMGKAVEVVPVLWMLARPIDTIMALATTWAERLQEQGITAIVQDGRSTVGGGSLPGTTLPTKLLAIESRQIEQLATQLRTYAPPIIGRIQNDHFLLDPRTVFPHQVETLLAGVVQCTQELEI